jgi:hypothetical protein
MDVRTVSVPPPKSVSDHRRPHSSPRRIPVVATTQSMDARCGLYDSAAASNPRTSSTLGAADSVAAARGGVAASAGDRTIQPQRTAWRSAERRKAW